MDTLRQDFTFACRSLIRRPSFTLLAVFALALGIGANTAIFSVLEAVVLRPLAFHQPERLVALYETNPERGWQRAQVAGANYLDWQEQARSFETLAAHNDWLSELTFTGDGEPEMLFANKVTGNFFECLGVTPVLGRSFLWEETWEPEHQVVMLSDGLWRRRFGSDLGVVGRTVLLDGEQHTVVGVMPPGLRFPFEDVELWVPVGWQTTRRQQVSFRRAHGLRVVGRLAEGVGLDQARRELGTIAGRLEQEYPETNTQMGAGLMPLHDWVVGESRQPLGLLLVAVALVLWVACGNVAHLLLARAAGREAEMAVRCALGAGRWRLVRLALCESLLLAVVGGAAGFLLGIWATRLVIALAPVEMPRLHQAQVNGPLVLFALALSIATALLFGALPALRGARPQADAFRPAARSSSGRSSQLGARMLVGSQVAMTVLLLVASGLFLRSLERLERVDPGFVPENTLAVGVSLPARSYSEEAEVLGFYERLFARLEALPGVEAVAAASRLPFKEQRWSSDFSADGWSADRYGVGVRHDEVTAGYFATMGIPLLAGRDFTATDNRQHPLVVVINETLAQRHFSAEDPIGQKIAFDREPGPDSYWWTIVGVVGDVRREGPGTPPKMSIYAPFSQDWAPGRTMHVMVRTASEPLAQVSAVRAAVAKLDPNLALVSTYSMDQLRGGALARDRFLLLLLTGFAGIALLLAVVGVYGAVSYATSRRTQEIGIRMAVGADDRDVVRSVLVEGLAPVIAGLVVGLSGALALSGILTGLLYEISPADPATYGGAAALLLSVAALACVVPARRATLVDPVVALRNE